jgi:hypothetical protein
MLPDMVGAVIYVRYLGSVSDEKKELVGPPGFEPGTGRL